MRSLKISVLINDFCCRWDWNARERVINRWCRNRDEISFRRRIILRTRVLDWNRIRRNNDRTELVLRSVIARVANEDSLVDQARASKVKLPLKPRMIVQKTATIANRERLRASRRYCCAAMRSHLKSLERCIVEPVRRFVPPQPHMPRPPMASTTLPSAGSR